MKTDTILIAAAVVGGIILLTKGKIGNYAGQSTGAAAGGLIAGATEGVIQSTLIDPYNWASAGTWKKNDSNSYSFSPTRSYIPIIDDVAKAAIGVKNWGKSDRWFT